MTAPATDACTAARDRPAPAADVRLVGELQGSGFVEQQWLVQRGERFVQVTELLYRVLEQANGIRTLDEIAEAVTESSEWLVTADDVALLVERKLVPLGLVRAEAATSAPEVAPPATDPSPLALNMRMKAVGPRLLDPITRALQYLFTPLVLVAALAFGLGAHVWLYSSHGLTAAVVDALYTPGFLPILLGLVLASGVAHELGHAAGLRYGGGRARRMGFGFYLAFPAFFTDVTDSYRLGRWARVRTGLGGVYFHFLFATALIGIALAVDAEFLFLAVLLINIEIVRQFIPFVRLDGYWVLADLTGVPDFLSQAGPFVRSLLPADRVRGPRLPRLKRWVKAAFLGYLVVTLPALGVMLYFALRFLPTLATILWDAVATQIDLFSYSRALGDSLGMATAAVELLVLVLPVFGLVYLLYLLSLKPIGAVLRASGLVRRVAGLTAITALLALLGYWWAPQLPVAKSAAPAGVKTFDVAERSHTREPVTYEQMPPVGGRHAPVWQNCGFYDSPVRNENAVHSLEHGAVWITYRPQLADGEVARLRGLAHGHDHVLVTPYPGLPAPVVASAWGRQLRAGSARDARVERFVNAFRLGSQAPDPGGPCSGGTGTPR